MCPQSIDASPTLTAYNNTNPSLMCQRDGTVSEDAF